MDDPKDSPLRRAEESAKRVLERLGSVVDKKVLGRGGSDFGADYAGELASRIERSIESSLRPDDAGNARLAPHHFKVALTYEEASKLTARQIESLAQELQGAAFEFIHNRRYQTQGSVQVEVVSDLFATSTTVKADFKQAERPGADQGVSSGDAAQADQPQTTGRAPRPGDSGPQNQTVALLTIDGREYRIDLARGGAPQYIGRVAGNAVRLDDPSVSRVHCSLAMRGDGQIVISDLDSANGTFVNGQVVNHGEAQILQAGDEIAVGEAVLRLGLSGSGKEAN